MILNTKDAEQYWFCLKGSVLPALTNAVSGHRPQWDAKLIPFHWIQPNFQRLQIFTRTLFFKAGSLVRLSFWFFDMHRTSDPPYNPGKPMHCLQTQAMHTHAHLLPPSPWILPQDISLQTCAVIVREGGLWKERVCLYWERHDGKSSDIFLWSLNHRTEWGNRWMKTF